MPKWPRMLEWSRLGCSLGPLRDEIAEISDKLKAPDSDAYRRARHGHYRRVRPAALLRSEFFEAHDSSTAAIADSPKCSMLHTLIGQRGEEGLLLPVRSYTRSAGSCTTSIQHATRSHLDEVD
jgi:hypothetical protein